MSGGGVARDISTFGSKRVARAVFAAAVPPYVLKTDNSPEGALDDATVEEFLDGIADDRLAFLDGFATNFFSAGTEAKVSEQQRRYARQRKSGPARG